MYKRQLLTFVWVLVYGGVGFARYYRRHQTILESERKILTELDGLPEPATLIEEDYQELLHRLYEEKLEVESKGRISRQELVDYYGPVSYTHLDVYKRQQQGQLYHRM